jgi:hypothetical protein
MSPKQVFDLNVEFKKTSPDFNVGKRRAGFVYGPGPFVVSLNLLCFAVVLSGVCAAESIPTPKAPQRSIFPIFFIT